MFFANIRAMRDRVVKRDLWIGPKHTRSADRVDRPRLPFDTGQ